MNIEPITKHLNWWLTGVLALILIALFWGYAQLADTPEMIINTEEIPSDPFSGFIYQAPATLNYFLNEDAATFAMHDRLSSILPLVTLNFATWENDVEAEITARYEEDAAQNRTLYDLNFESVYQFSYGEIPTTTLEFIFPFPENLATLHDVQFLVNGEEATDVQFSPQQIRWVTPVVSGDEFEIGVQYKASGEGQFVYALRQGLRADSLDATFVVKGAPDSTVAAGSLPPTDQNRIDGKDVFTWQYNDLIVDQNIQLDLPIAQTIAEQTAVFQYEFTTLRQIAPLLVILFLLSFALILRMTEWRLSLPGYLILGLTAAWFYPLFTFLSSEIGIVWAGILATGIVFVLLLLFLRLMLKTWRVGLLLAWPFFICIGMLSLGMFSSYSAVWLAVGGTLLGGTLLVAYAQRPFTFEPTSPTTVTESEAAEQPDTPTIYCPQCGRLQDEDFDYCPSCGFDNEQLQRCQHCHHEQIINTTAGDDEQIAFCLHCGQQWQATTWQLAI